MPFALIAPHEDQTPFTSTITFSPYLTINGRYGYTIRSSIWLKDNKWKMQGDIRFLYYPQYTWGLESNAGDGHKLLTRYKYARFYQTLFREIKPHLLIGVGYHLDYHYDIDTGHDSVTLERFVRYHYGTTGSESSLSSGITLNILYDKRKNPADSDPGFYGNIVYRYNPTILGSTESWQSLYLDLRRYISFSHTQKNMLAFWAYYWTVLDKKAPFLDLPSIGWDPYQQRSARGFDQNRYRGKGLSYFEMEYRRDLTKNGQLGFVLFGNINSLSAPFTDDFSYPHIGYGGGIRIKCSRRSPIKIAIDYGRSKGYSGISLNLGETF